MNRQPTAYREQRQTHRISAMTKRVCASFLILTSSWSIAAPYSTVVNQLSDLVKKEDFVNAYQYSEQHAFDHAGRVEFDLLAGLAAFGLERYQEAIFAFERVLHNSPDSYIGRFYLAQCYRHVDNFVAARTELEFLQSRPLTESQRGQVQRLLRRIDNQQARLERKWGHSIKLHTALDSNINSGTTIKSIELPELGTITLLDNAREKSDMAYGLQYNAYYQYPLNQNQVIKANVEFGHVDYLQHHEFRRNPISLSLSFAQDFDFGKLAATGFIKPLLLEGQDYRMESGLSLALQKETSRRTAYSASAGYSYISKDENSDLDVDRLKAQYSFFYKTKFLHTFMLHGYFDFSREAIYEFNDKTAFGAMYQISWPLSDRLSASAFGLLEAHQYKASHPLFLEIRSETLTALNGQLNYAASEKLTLQLYTNVQYKSSNIELYQYNRAEVGASWQYHF